MKKDRRTDAMMMLAGMGLGAMAMYFWDPDRGRARRALKQDQVAGRVRSGGRSLRSAGSTIGDRARGWTAEMRGRMSNELVTDRQLVERVRSELGHHAGSLQHLDVEATGGEVTLRGRASGISPDQVVRVVEHVRGVETVRDELDRSGS